MLKMRTRRGGMIALAIVVVVVVAVLVGAIGCSAGSSEVTTTYAASYATATTAAGAVTTVGRGDEAAGAPAPSADYSSSSGAEGAFTGTLTALAAASGQKIISDAQLEIEVEAGKFQTVFDLALMLATRYGGYLVNSSSYASGEENTMKSGTVAVRVPSNSFTQALSDAGKLGTLKNQTLSTQDVTEEYVDLEARIKNSEAHVNSLVALLSQAKTVDEILQVQSVLTYAQQDLEQLKGRLRYLDANTSYSTITLSIYEKGTEPVVASAWGTGSAFKDALHYVVRVFNGIIRGLGVLIPVLIVLAIIGYIVYRIVMAVARRNRERQQAMYQPRPQQGWGAPPPAGFAAPDGGAGATQAVRPVGSGPGAAAAAGPGEQSSANAEPTDGG
jgi:hypothetical protein